MGSGTKPIVDRTQYKQDFVIFTPRMDLFTLIPRTLIGVAYPGFASLKAVLSDSPESSVAWMKYWVVLGVFSVVELLLDPVLNPLTYSFPTYLIIKCLFLAWCMAPIEFNGSDVIFNNILFPIFKEHHEQIEEQAENTKMTVMQKLGLCIKKEKDDKGEKIEKSDLKKME
eukprot:TRINITY_DN8391_c0_g1_i2.p1 TRINITY_DN8391_c0_g1~~TRINITY_DN8391_c0_g1_i2.p1  ORF type:complete len:182 (-),score=62.13 TRINITY_DN8391_c0_g1_i2:56-565(-)